MMLRSATYRTITLTSVLLLCACSSLSPPLSTTAPPPVIVRTESALDGYVEMLAKLSTSDKAMQSDTFFAIEQGNLQAPTTMNQLRYALALALPGHPASDPIKAKKLLEQTLANPERLSASELSMSRTMLGVAEQWLKLQAENRRLAATVDDRTRTQSNSERRFQAQTEELNKLRKALDEAQQKLDAIRDIEKSISERSTTPSGTRDSGNRDTPSQTQTSPAGR